MIQLRNFSYSTVFRRSSALHFFEKSFLRKKKYKHADCYFITNSPHTHDYYQKVLPHYMRKNVHLISYGFNYEKFYNPTVKTLPSTHEPIKLVNIGSFQEKKNQLFLIEIAKSLIVRQVKFEIHMLGDGLDFEKVKKSVHQNGLEDYIFLHGNVTDVESWLKMAHLYVHCALYEPFGLVFLEAMAGGLPCVSLNGMGNEVLFEQDKNGALLDKQDPELFADTILSLTGNQNKYQEMSAYCKKFAKQYSLEKKAKELVNFYFSIMNVNSSN